MQKDSISFLNAVRMYNNTPKDSKGGFTPQEIQNSQDSKNLAFLKNNATHPLNLTRKELNLKIKRAMEKVQKRKLEKLIKGNKFRKKFNGRMK